MTDQVDPSKPKKNEFMTDVIPKLVIVVVTVVVTTLVNWWVNSAAPHLRYSVVQSAKFSGQTQKFGFVAMTITNDGSKKAEDVKCLIEFEDSVIQDLQAEPSVLDPVVKFESEKKKATITVPTLNAGESLRIAVMTDKPSQMSRMYVRGKDVLGVTGDAAQSGVAGLVLGAFWGVILFGLGGGVMIGTFKTLDFFVAMSEKRKRKLEQLNPKKRFRFGYGPAKGRIITGDDAIKLYDSMTMQQTRLQFEGVEYKVSDKKTDDDGTIEIEMSPMR